MGLSTDPGAQMHVHRCVYLRYQSMQDRRELRDILRCNPKYHDRPRYDCALINIDDSPDDLTVVRLCGLCRCRLNARGHEEDVALVKYFKQSTYKPNAVWRGCRKMDEEGQYEFVLLKYLIRGAHMIPVFNRPRTDPTNTFYFNDVVDNDMYMRATPELHDLYF